MNDISQYKHKIKYNAMNLSKISLKVIGHFLIQSENFTPKCL